ncbi:MAG: hypothetical protein AAB889_00265 [Patescibacteria group bacterium]
MSAIVYIDTSDQDTAKVAVEIDGKQYEKTSQSRVMKAQMVLPLIEILLKEHAIQLSDISEIRVYEGSGSYTGIRVGMSVANALALLLGIPVTYSGTHW